MKILMVCFKYPPVYSGYGKQASTINNEILKSNSDINIKILTGRFMKQKKYESERISVIPIGMSLISRISEPLTFYFFATSVFFWIIFYRKQIDIIHCIKAGPEAAMAVLAGKIIKKPTIVKIAQDELSIVERNKGNKLKRIIRMIRDKILLKADNFIAISSDIERRLINRNIPETKIHKIPNGVDINKFYKITKEKKEELKLKLNIPLDNIIILFSGSISKRKGIFDLLNVIKNLNIDKRVQFIICGPLYEQKEYFYKLVNEINNNSIYITVSYRGEVKKIEEFFQISDILVLPSYSEGLPNVLLEGGASGLAMVASNIPGCNDVIKDGETGLLFQVGNLDSLEGRLLHLINDRKYTNNLGEAAYLWCTSTFAHDVIAKKYTDLYYNIYHQYNCNF